MSKKSKVAIILMTILIIVLAIALIYTIYSYNNEYSYTNRRTIQTTVKSQSLNESFSENNSIDLDDLTVKLSGVTYEPDGNEYMQEGDKNVFGVTLDFESKEDLNVTDLVYDFIIFDENNEIINNSVNFGTNDTKKYVQGFIKDKYNENGFNSFSKLNEHAIKTGLVQKNNTSEDLTNFSEIIYSPLTKEINPKQVNVRIINLRYQFEGKDKEYLPNTDLEFVVDFE